MKNCIVIPTYWSTPEQETWKMFDHPTPLDESGTLRRTLENLQEMRIDIPVILFPVPTDRRVEEKVKGLAAGLNLDVRVFSGAEREEMTGILAKSGFGGRYMEAIHMDTYGGVRNMGLFYVALKGYENVIQLDDDEIIEERDYLSKALAFIGTKVGDQKVVGKTGYYLDEQGRAYYDGQAANFYRNWPKDDLFNEAVRRNMQAEGPLVPTMVGFGGNMVINREMFLRVCFDPYGNRGEDDEYEMNAVHKGMKFFFDQKLWVKHLPPKRRGRYWTRHRQDVIRFKYLREKMLLYGMTPDELGVFHGHFVRDDLEYKAVSSSVEAALHFVDKDRDEFREFLNTAVLAVELGRQELRERARKALAFQQHWLEVMPGLAGTW